MDSIILLGFIQIEVGKGVLQILSNTFLFVKAIHLGQVGRTHMPLGQDLPLISINFIADDLEQG